MTIRAWPKTKSGRKKTGQEIEDELFKKMSADRKLQIVSNLTAACLRLHKLVYGNNGLKKIYRQNSVNSDRVQG